MGLRHPSEWRTLVLLAAVYLSIGLVLWNPFLAPLWLQMICLTPLVTLHSSLQHECLHGHPLSNQTLNDALVVLPVGLFVPYARFKVSHLRHHHQCELTVPESDPESAYLTDSDWRARSPVTRRLLSVNNTLAGRVMLGPIFGLSGFILRDWQLSGARAVWCRHLISVVVLLGLVSLLSPMPVWAYVVSAYAGYSVLTVRTFLEHQADEDHRARTVVIEDRGPLSFLFLNNNLHAVHHAYPNLAWYELPGLFYRNRSRFLTLNRHYWYPNYWAIIRQYAFRRKEPVVYPSDTAAECSTTHRVSQTSAPLPTEVSS